MHDSLKEHHPEAEFWMLLIDDAPLPRMTQAAMERRDIHILRAADIGLPPEEIANFRFIYNIVEVSTAYKPWVMNTVVRRTGMHVFYLDPDIRFFAPMTALVEAVQHHELEPVMHF